MNTSILRKRRKNMEITEIIEDIVKLTFRIIFFILKTIFITIPVAIYKLLNRK